MLVERLQATDNFSHSDEVWYCNVLIGKNTLGTFMSSISKELKLSQKYGNHCIRATAVSLLDECNFEARHIMHVLGHKSESSIHSYSRCLSEVKQTEISDILSSTCSVENLESTSTAIVAMHEQASENSLGRSTVPNSPMTMQNFASHSQETVNFNAGAFSGANVTINFTIRNDFAFSCTSKHL